MRFLALFKLEMMVARTRVLSVKMERMTESRDLWEGNTSGSSPFTPGADNQRVPRYSNNGTGQTLSRLSKNSLPAKGLNGHVRLFDYVFS